LFYLWYDYVKEPEVPPGTAARLSPDEKPSKVTIAGVEVVP
jgi:hypothetical protein